MAEIVALRSTSADGPLQLRLDAGILTIVLASPPANALSLGMMAALQREIDRAEADPSIRVVVIGAQGRVFSAGHDLKELTSHRTDPDEGRAFFAQTMAACSTLMQSVVRCAKPVIASVDGAAFAAGLQLVASCDLAIASHEATFCTPGVNIGLFCSTPMVALSRSVSRKQAMEMLLTGETIDAPTARDFGLVNRVVPREYLDQVVSKYARTIADKSPLTLRIGKRAFQEQAEMDLVRAYEHTSRVMVENMMAADAAEGISAFLEKRRPVWTGR